MEPPVLVKPIPAQVVNEQAAYGPFNLDEYIQASDGAKLRFQAELVSGQSLPKGMICTSDGVVTGIPAKDTQGNYEIKITAENDAGSINTILVLTIKPSLSTTSEAYVNQLKSQVWQALEKQLPIPDLTFTELSNLPISFLDIYYLLERWGTLTIWDAFNLEPAGEKQLLNLEGASPHYNVYDRGSCLVMAPKDLFSYERTVEDGLKTVRAMAKEVYKRQWVVEFAGLDKFTRAVWIEIQHLGDHYGKRLEVINYKPSLDDVKVYSAQALEAKMRGGME